MKGRKVTLTLLALALIAAVAYAGYSRQASRTAGTALPSQVAGLKLVDLVSGEEAVRSISRLHGTSIDVVDGYVATYQRQQEKAVLWVAMAQDEARASELMDIMVQKMENNAVFSRPVAMNVNNRVYYYSVGAGMSNYFYVDGSRVIWVGIASQDEGAIMHEVTKALK